MSSSCKMLAAIAAAALLAPLAFASNPAYDNASSYWYNDGWQTGDNGGFGFQPWLLSVSGTGGQLIWKSTTNGDGLDNGIVGGVAGDGDIDTTIGPNPDNGFVPPNPVNVTDPRSWGMWNAGGVTDAIRPFNGVLQVGQQFQVDFDNGYVASGQTVGVGLYNAANQPLWEVYFIGGNGFYFNHDAAGQVATVVSYGDEGLHVSFVLTGPNSYSMTLTRRDGVNQTINGILINQGDQNIAEFRAFDANGQGGGDPYNFYVNSMVVPDPPTVGLVVMGLLGAGAFLRRRTI